jgi:hypothetical protein
VTAGDLRALPSHDSALRHAVLVVGVRVLSSRREELRIVQQGSTATGRDGGGLVCIVRHGDLRLRTPVDGLPLDGMQEVSGSSPLSSTSSTRSGRDLRPVRIHSKIV